MNCIYYQPTKTTVIMSTIAQKNFLQCQYIIVVVVD